MSFSIKNSTVDTSVNKVAFNNAPTTFPKLASVTAVLTTPIINDYNTNLQLTLVGDSTNFDVNSDNIYNSIFGNYLINWSINITVPSATAESPVFICPLIYYYNGGSYYNYSYNTIQINSGDAQTFNFKNTFQNTWGDVSIYFQIHLPLKLSLLNQQVQMGVKIIKIKYLFYYFF